MMLREAYRLVLKYFHFTLRAGAIGGASVSNMLIHARSAEQSYTLSILKHRKKIFFFGSKEGHNIVW